MLSLRTFRANEQVGAEVFVLRLDDPNEPVLLPGPRKRFAGREVQARRNERTEIRPRLFV